MNMPQNAKQNIKQGLVMIEAYKPIQMPCGGTAYFDEGAGYGYRCWDCMAVVGSIGMPQSCREEYRKTEILDILAGKQKGYTF